MHSAFVDELVKKCNGVKHSLVVVDLLIVPEMKRETTPKNVRPLFFPITKNESTQEHLD